MNGAGALRLRTDGRDKHRLALHGDPRVQEIAAVCGNRPLDPMFELLFRALYTGWNARTRSAVRGLVTAQTELPSEAFESAFSLAQAAVLICQEVHPAKGDLRGAVVEAVTEAVVGRRATVLEEVVVSTEDGDTPPIDIGVDGDPLEFYQCKSDPWEFSSTDAQRFEAVRHAADRAKRRCVLAIATLKERNELAQALDRLTIMVPIYAATRQDLSAIAEGAPTFMISPIS